MMMMILFAAALVSSMAGAFQLSFDGAFQHESLGDGKMQAVQNVELSVPANSYIVYPLGPMLFDSIVVDSFRYGISKKPEGVRLFSARIAGPFCTQYPTRTATIIDLASLTKLDTESKMLTSVFAKVDNPHGWTDEYYCLVVSSNSQETVHPSFQLVWTGTGSFTYLIVLIASIVLGIILLSILACVACRCARTRRLKKSQHSIGLGMLQA